MLDKKILLDISKDGIVTFREREQACVGQSFYSVDTVERAELLQATLCELSRDGKTYSLLEFKRSSSVVLPFRDLYWAAELFLFTEVALDSDVKTADGLALKKIEKLIDE